MAQTEWPQATGVVRHELVKIDARVVAQMSLQHLVLLEEHPLQVHEWHAASRQGIWGESGAASVAQPWHLVLRVVVDVAGLVAPLPCVCRQQAVRIARNASRTGNATVQIRLHSASSAIAQERIALLQELKPQVPRQEGLAVRQGHLLSGRDRRPSDQAAAARVPAAHRCVDRVRAARIRRHGDVLKDGRRPGRLHRERVGVHEFDHNDLLDQLACNALGPRLLGDDLAQAHERFRGLGQLVEALGVVAHEHLLPGALVGFAERF
mmetsp:Transcript_36314/g.104531  ORF Transcript_36314/g.104531 Transcript_36314/m.104531 type:complete len:265 (-) Transcript_36314:555-1349(-)